MESPLDVPVWVWISLMESPLAQAENKTTSRKAKIFRAGAIFVGSNPRAQKAKKVKMSTITEKLRERVSPISRG